MSNYASEGKHAKHRYILAVNLPDTFRCPKRQITTKKYKIICLSSMCYLNRKKKQSKVQFAHCLFKICPPKSNDSIQAEFWPFSYGVTHLLRKQYPYIWLPFPHHSVFVIYVCRISAAVIQIRYPDSTKFHDIFSLFLTKCSASREAFVSINFSTNSENQNNQIRMNWINRKKANIVE